MKDMLLLICVFLTPCIQLALNISSEISLSTFIGGYNFFYTEIFILFIIFGQIFLFKKLKNNKINVLILLGLLISFLSCWVNGYDNWFSRFLIGIDFYFYGLLLSVVDFNQKQLQVIRYPLLLLFYFICAQMILISTGVVNSDRGGVDMDGLVRFGSTAGSSIQSGFLIFILMALLVLLFTKRSIFIGIYAMGVYAIAFSLSRGPILSVLFVAGLYALIHLKKYRKQIFLFVIITGVSLFVLEKRYHFLTIMDERNSTEDVTSGRNERWMKTVDIYRQSSFLFGAGSAITPSERMSKSEVTTSVDLLSSPHNIYLSFLVENGLLGIFNLIMLLTVLIKMLIKSKIHLSYPFLTFLSIPLIMMNTEIILRNGVVAFFFWFLFYLLKNKTLCDKLN